MTANKESVYWCSDKSWYFINDQGNYELTEFALERARKSFDLYMSSMENLEGPLHEKGNDIEEYVPEWNKMIFTSYISVTGQLYMLSVDEKGVELHIGQGDVIERITLNDSIHAVKELLYQMNIYAWPIWVYNLVADGERWEFRFYNNGELVFAKYGANAYPMGYGLWYAYLKNVLNAHGEKEIASCYRKDQEGMIQRKKV